MTDSKHKANTTVAQQPQQLRQKKKVEVWFDGQWSLGKMNGLEMDYKRFLVVQSRKLFEVLPLNSQKK